MGLNSTKQSSLTNADYSVTLSSTYYRAQQTIQGEFHLNIRTKLRIEKEIRIDLIGELIDKRSKRTAQRQSSTTQSNKNIFFTYPCTLVTSHENGTARTIKHQQITYPFRIPLGNSLPPTCDFKDNFSINYYLDIIHDGHLLPQTHKPLTIGPPQPIVISPQPVQVNGASDLQIICGLQKNFYSSSQCVPITVHINNPKQKQILRMTAQLMQLVRLNANKREYEIFTALLNEIPENNKTTTITTNCEIILPSNLAPTFVTNDQTHPDNLPIVNVQYEFRITAHMKGALATNVKLTLPIGIE
ncbi:unnamed protein product [Didymodactylos carnosus]|uniref:Arrestin C-terminal-like domain-containing protein n=1 Tax=Didymodactylos carnosus TaxID=1234261 RepID=A0A8S2HAF3_9BILA|nr:unnamed protein product [Didymodactylos carnosus]CAF3620612.1 unnamed protein product [Didymodactylos carnosus]